MLYNIINKVVLESYVYHRQGPIVITRNIDEGIIINNTKFDLEFVVNQEFNLTGYK